jgi:ammonia channel protein AmtB
MKSGCNTLVAATYLSRSIKQPAVTLSVHVQTFCLCDMPAAGGTVVHMSSGYAALVAAIYLGKSVKHPAGHESGMFEDIKEPANVPIVMLGTGLLWMGWFGVSWV